MSGFVINAAHERVVDFSGLIIGAAQELVLADKVDTVQWGEVTVLVRVHSHSLAGGAGTIAIGSYGQSYSAQDPGLAFLDRTDFESVLIDNNTSSPAFLKFLAQNTHMLRIVASGVRSSAGQVRATVSVDISGKDI